MATKLALVNGRYRLGDPLDPSGEARCFHAFDTRGGGAVVLKVVAVDDRAARARLVAEFERLAELDHPGLPEVVELGEVQAGGALEEGALFVATALLDGPDAVAACRGLHGAALARQVARILADIALALEALHAAGLVHHDVKPSHILSGPDGHFRLIDLGLVRTSGSGDGRIHGTLAYLSPDALAGSVEPQVDLYALGASAYELLAGHPPYAASDPAALLDAQASPRPSPPGPAVLVALIGALLELDPMRRPSRARVIVDELARAGLIAETRRDEARGVAPLGRPGFVASSSGREAVLVEVARAIDGHAVVALVGPAGSGRTRLLVEVDRRRAIDALRAGTRRRHLIGPSLFDAARELGQNELLTSSGHGDAARARTAIAARLVDALVARDAILHLAGADERMVAALIAVAARLPPASGGRVLLELDPDVADRVLGGERGVARVDLPSLDEEEVARLCARLIGREDPPLAAAVRSLSHGRVRAVIELVRAAHARAQERRLDAGVLGPTVADVRAVRITDLEAELGAATARLGPDAQLLLAALSLLDRPVELEMLRRALGDAPVRRALAELASGGLVAWSGERLLPESTMIARAALAGLSGATRASLGDKLLTAIDTSGELLDGAWLAHRLVRDDAPARAERALRVLLTGVHAMTEAPLALGIDRALALSAIVPGPQSARLEGELLLGVAEYARAAARLRAAVDGMIDAPGVEEVQLLLARATRLAGEPATAEQLAKRLAAHDNEVGSRAQALLGRLLLDRGDFAGAARVVATPHAGGDLAAQAERLEVRGVAALQAGELSGARQAFTALAQLLAHAASSRRARAEGLLGMVAQAEGALEEAAAAYASALGLADDDADLHGAAAYALNLGGTLRELGEHARALPVLERAVAVLTRVGRAEELSLALFNLGNLHLSLGDLDAATEAAGAALARCGEGDRRAAVYARLLGADVERRRGAPHAARALGTYDALLVGELGADERLLVEAARAETLAEEGRVADATEAIAGCAGLRAAALATPAVIAHATLTEARARLATAAQTPLPEDMLRTLRDDAALAQRTHQRERALHLEITLGRDAIRRADLATTRSHLTTALALYEEIRMRTPELRRAALAEDPDVRRLQTLVEAAEPTASSAPSRRLLEINKRLNSELDLDRLLALIMETVIELSRAERGFLLMRGPTGDLEVRVEQNVEAASRAGVTAFSRSIAERAVSLGDPIVTVDAAGDQRFQAALSVSDLRLRSVLAVPLAVKGRVVGCVYVDHRARVGLFRPADVALVVDLAEQAAIAVENARLLAENQRRELEVRALNAELEARLASQAVELEGMHREVREARRSLGVRYDYTALIGQTPRMLELFRLLDRVTDTALPVVIYGESGTGKELVAHALHHNGPRRKAAFVSESCGAIPETLLEAALFGHVRGAFTGAQGERRGLFEIADGGTLFLDEVGEMSPAMQVRLLRVLQEGEFRRVGGEKVVKVDVRVLVASNRDLGRMVEEGRFREDLFYRLNVVRVALPPLRERAADIPLLVAHFLAARPDGPGITRRALDRLTRYRWPGNVRQLENELARAASMAEGTIDLADLTPQVASGSEDAEVDGPEPLDLHGRVERLERGLLEEALVRTGGNQSEAARLLGLSRFGLQKKMRRYDMQKDRPVKRVAR